jgi:hypothetical protein
MGMPPTLRFHAICPQAAEPAVKAVEPALTGDEEPRCGERGGASLVIVHWSADTGKRWTGIGRG